MQSADRHFPVYADHSEVKCFNCERPLPGPPRLPVATYPEGKYYKVCGDCVMATWYDIAPAKAEAQ